MVEVLKETKNFMGDIVQLVVNEKGNYSRRMSNGNSWYYQCRYGKNKEKALNEWKRSFEK